MKADRMHWAWFFCLWCAAIIALGAVFGAFGFLIAGRFLDGHVWYRDVFSGMHHGAFFALIWAPGLALVFSVMRARRNRDRALS